MDRDHGWIHTLLEEAENERMHLLTFLKLRKPSLIFRMSVVATQVMLRCPPSLASSSPIMTPIASQGIFMNLFFITYLVHPPLCHR
jgi:hypothetical protein